jgi:hypothetical protein
MAREKAKLLPVGKSFKKSISVQELLDNGFEDVGKKPVTDLGKLFTDYSANATRPEVKETPVERAEMPFHHEGDAEDIPFVDPRDEPDYEDRQRFNIAAIFARKSNY